MSAPSKVRFSQTARQVCKSNLNFIAPHCPFCLPARGYQLCCQREYPWRHQQALALSAFEAQREGRHELEDREKHRSHFAGWAAEQRARMDLGAQSTHAVTLTQPPVAPVALVSYSLGLPGESPKSSNRESCL